MTDSASIASAVGFTGLNRNFVRPRFAFALALRRLFCYGVSKARKPADFLKDTLGVELVLKPLQAPDLRVHLYER